MSRGSIRFLQARFGAGNRQTPRTTCVCGGSGQFPTVTSLVVGHDRQPESLAALEVAIDMANRLNAALHIVHVVNLGDYPANPESADWEAYAVDRLAEEQAMVIDSLGDHPLEWHYYVGRGDPARRLIQVAEDNDALMIIVGSHGEGLHTWLSRLVEPAVSHRLIESARHPVLVIREPNERINHRPQLHAV